MILVDLYPNSRLLMHCDSDVIRKLLLAIDQRKESRLEELKIYGIEKEVLLRHIELMFEDGLVKGEICYSSRGGPDGHLPDRVLIRDITPKGHELFRVMSNEGIWDSMKSKFTPSEFAMLPFSVIRDVGLGLLSAWAKSKVGL